MKAVQLFASEFLPDVVRPLEPCKKSGQWPFPIHLNRLITQAAALKRRRSVFCRPFPRGFRASGSAHLAGPSRGMRAEGAFPTSAQTGEGCGEHGLTCGRHPHLPSLL